MEKNNFLEYNYHLLTTMIQNINCNFKLCIHKEILTCNHNIIVTVLLNSHLINKLEFCFYNYNAL